jgi:hypothetical protein
VAPTYPITDHVPEAELLAVTSGGARRWLTTRGWKGIPCPDRGWWYVEQGSALDDYDAPTVLVPEDGVKDYALRVAQLMECLAYITKAPARAILATMQADSRIVAECAKMAAKGNSSVGLNGSP